MNGTPVRTYLVCPQCSRVWIGLVVCGNGSVPDFGAESVAIMKRHYSECPGPGPVTAAVGQQRQLPQEPE